MASSTTQSLKDEYGVVVLNPHTMVTNTTLDEGDVELMYEVGGKYHDKYKSVMSSKEHRIKMTREIEKWCRYFLKRAENSSKDDSDPLSEEFLHNFTFQIGAHSGYFMKMAMKCDGMGYALHLNNVFYPTQSFYGLSKSIEIPENYDI